MHIRRHFLFSATLLLVAGCDDAVRTLPPPPAGGGGTDYLLGPGDKVRVLVFNETQLSGEYLVDPTGAISVPLIGNITAMNLTTERLAAAIGARLEANGYLRNPSVSVQVLQTRPFYVLGEVQKPGEFPFRAGLTVSAAVAMAGGFTFRANQRRVMVARQGGTGEVPVETTSAFTIYPGDVLRVVERYF